MAAELSGIGPLELRSGRQVRAARAMLGWEQADLARAANLSVPTVHRMETMGVEHCSIGSLLKVQRVFEMAGVTFPAAGEGDRRELGVRLRVGP